MPVLTAVTCGGMQPAVKPITGIHTCNVHVHVVNM